MECDPDENAMKIGVFVPAKLFFRSGKPDFGGLRAVSREEWEVV